MAHALGDRLYGVRLDTPAERGRVTPDLVREVRARLDQAGFEHVKIIVSGGLTPDRIRIFKDAERAGRLVRGRQLHQRRHADRLHRRPQGDRRQPDRQARPDPRAHAEPTAAAGRPPGLDGHLTADLDPESEHESALESEHESAYELLQRGQALMKQRHNAQAAVVLERAARLEPGKGSILEALGRAYYNSGQHQRAAVVFGELLEIDPSAAYGHYALGQSFKQMGRRAEARTHLRLACALDPDSALYRAALARLG